MHEKNNCVKINFLHMNKKTERNYIKIVMAVVIGWWNYVLWGFSFSLISSTFVNFLYCQFSLFLMKWNKTTKKAKTTNLLLWPGWGQLFPKAPERGAAPPPNPGSMEPGPHFSQHSHSCEKQARRRSDALRQECFRNERIRNSCGRFRPMTGLPLQRQLKGRQGERKFRAESELANGWIKLKMHRRLFQGTTSVGREQSAVYGIWHLWTNQQLSASWRRRVQSYKCDSISPWKGRESKAMVRRKKTI